jgi:hypothetical protein
MTFRPAGPAGIAASIVSQKGGPELSRARCQPLRRTRSTSCAASLPCIFEMSSWYFSSTPSVLFTTSGSRTTASSASSARVHSIVSATPGSL